MHTTSRLGLDIPDPNDLESGYPADAVQSLGVLDNAAIFQSGTLAGKPDPATTVNGTLYYCTDTGALLLCMANSWVWVNGNSEVVGTIKQFSGTKVPYDADGVMRWRLCDGSLLSRTTYATLFSAIGTAWGLGDGTSTFAIPNLQGRVLVGAGAGSGGLSTRAVAQNGGEEGHTLTAAELGAHNHALSVNDPGHVTTFANYNIPVSDTPLPWSGVVLSTGPYNTGTVPSIANNAGSTYVGNIHSIRVSSLDYTGVTITGDNGTSGITFSAGDNVSHNNMQPFAVTNHIIKFQ